MGAKKINNHRSYRHKIGQNQGGKKEKQKQVESLKKTSRKNDYQ